MVGARLIAERRLAPRGHRARMSNRRFAFAAAVRVVVRVHTEPRTVGLQPMCAYGPLYRSYVLVVDIATWPTVAMQVAGTLRSSPDGSLRRAMPFSFAISCAMLPAARASCAPLPGYSSTLWTKVPVGILASGSALPGLMSADGRRRPRRRPSGRGCDDIRFSPSSY